MRISVIGLGKLGSPLAAVLADRGHRVIGVDLNGGFVERLEAGQAPVNEPDLQRLIDRSRERLRATTDVGVAIAGTDVTFIIVPTPSQENGMFTNEYVVAACRSIGAALRQKTSYHLVVVTSTVMPGSTGGEIRRALESASGRSVGEHLGLCYNPEFIALGSVIRDLTHPDMVLIGESDPKAGALLEQIHHSMCENQPAIRRMNWVNAEIVKISVNTFVTTKISYANMLAGLCEQLPGADVDVVTQAVGADTRIGTKYLKGALGYGGPCFPRDNVAFAALARAIGARADIAEATDRINRLQPERLVNLTRRLLPESGTVAVLGLSYKPDTGVIEESQAVTIARDLADLGYRVRAYDPEALPGAAAALGDKVTAADSLTAALSGAHLAILATAWPEFRQLPNLVRDRDFTIIDCWKMVDVSACGPRVQVVHLGRGVEAPVTAGR